MSNLKKAFFFSGLVSALAFSNLASAQDGTINFIATISSSACSVNSVSGSASTRGVVDFGTVSSKTFGTAGKHTVSTPFTIALTDCAVSSAPTITFEGTPVSTTGYTELYESGIVGLGIRIEDAGAPGTYYTSGTAAANTGLNTLTSTSVSSADAKFNAYLVDYKGATNYTGSIDTDVTFTINYVNS
ncbi:type 1 fimbrial protein [Enterobacteriaceae bacterium YMB-R22]|uniref:fimbrial protein n=1 Tax=Tenebrionicola larvae TaxID=2815733 RepID=UPI00201330AF|nr:fimbrial protein [Tenebrionicola larvae]MBV4412790.1 type 1 fimbrial protein [Tenebrionicola larvae]